MNKEQASGPVVTDPQSGYSLSPVAGSEVINVSDSSVEEMIAIIRESKTEINKLKEERNVLARELRTQAQKDAVIKRRLVLYQGMLMQFSYKSVRERFLKGLLVKDFCSNEVLSSIDIFMRMFLPSPIEALNDIETRMVDLGKLFSMDSSEPKDENGHPFPIRKNFSWWRNYFEVLINSDGWTNDNKVRDDDLSSSSCVPQGAHSINQEAKANVESFDHSVREANFPRNNFSEGTSFFKMDHDQGSSSTERRRINENQEDFLVRTLRSLGPRREVIPPSVFDPVKGGSIFKFFNSYERYFESKYDGTEREMAMHLEKYLSGTARSAYSALSGADMDYQDLKRKLISWHESQQVDRTDKLREDFNNATMIPGDSCSIYCLRLEKLAGKVFGESPREMESQLKRKLKSTGPYSLVQQIDIAEGIFSVTDEGSLSWKRLKKLVEQHDRKLISKSLVPVKENIEPVTLFSSSRWTTRPTDEFENYDRQPENWHCGSPIDRRKDVYWNTSNHKNRSPPRRGQQGQSIGRDRMPSSPSFQHSDPRSPRYGRSPPAMKSRDRVRCRACNKTGHTEKNCWGKQNRCFGCGSYDHWKSKCPLRKNTGYPHDDVRDSPNDKRVTSDSRPLNVRALGRVDGEQSF